jgi:hypothetical protein
MTLTSTTKPWGQRRPRLAAPSLYASAQSKNVIPSSRHACTSAVACSTDLGETGPLSQGVQAGRKALIIYHINGMEVRKKRPRGFK